MLSKLESGPIQIFLLYSRVSFFSDYSTLMKNKQKIFSALGMPVWAQSKIYITWVIILNTHLRSQIRIVQRGSYWPDTLWTEMILPTTKSILHFWCIKIMAKKLYCHVSCATIVFEIISNHYCYFISWTKALYWWCSN